MYRRAELLERRHVLDGSAAMFGLAVQLNDTFDEALHAALADLNNDGQLDLISAVYDIRDGGRLTVEFGNGDTTFSPAADFPNDDWYVANLTPFDVDQDGDLDLLALGNQSVISNYSLRWWINEGVVDGVWSGLTISDRLDISIPISTNAPTVLLDDFNGDGRVDLVLGGATLVVRFGNGDSSFGFPIAYGQVATGRAVAADDLDGDGDLDLISATAGEPGEMSVLLNDGEGFFEPRSYHSNGNQPWDMAMGDVDGDGDRDVAVAHRWFDQGLSIWFNNGDGTLDAEPRTYPIVGNPIELDWADIEGDGDLDLVVGSAYALHDATWIQVVGSTSVMINDGQGRMADPIVVACCDTKSVITEDLNHDGFVELISISENSFVFAQAPNAPFHQTASRFKMLDVVDELKPSVVSGDFNNDGRTDVVALDRKNAKLNVRLGTDTEEMTELPSIPARGSQVVVGQFNADRFLDLATLEDHADHETTITIYFGNNDGTFVNGLENRFDNVLANSSIVVDINNDGLDDFVSTSPTGNNVVPRLSLGDGTFDIGAPINAVSTSRFLLHDVLPNGQVARDELITWGELSHAVRLLQSEDNSWNEVFSFISATPIQSVAASDLNDDGHVDLVLVTAQNQRSDVLIFLGNGVGNFGAPSTIPVSESLGSIAIADINGDGRQDLVGQHFESRDLLRKQGVVVLLSNVQGTFDQVHYPAEIVRAKSGSNGPFGDLFIEDINRDGILDLVVPFSFWGITGQQPGGGVMLLLGEHDSQPTSPIYQVYQDAGYYRSAASGDFNGDGFPDVLLSGDLGYVTLFNSATRGMPHGDVNDDGAVNVADVDRLCEAVHGDLPLAESLPKFDLNRDDTIDLQDHTWLIERIFETTSGDSNLDGAFDSADLVQVFQPGLFEQPNAMASWSSGDWNCDGLFTTGDLVAAFRAGRYVNAAVARFGALNDIASAVNDEAKSDQRHHSG